MMRARLHLKLANVSFVLLFVAALGLLLWLTRDYHTQFDWTRNARNTLSPGSIALVKKLDQPVKIIAFASEQENLRKNIGELIARYRRYKPDLSLEFVNPDKDPTRVREAGIQFDGELLVQYHGNHETVNQPSEESITNALSRLARSGERWIVFLAGHGERNPDGQANFDLSTWAEQLRSRGLHTRALTLGANPQIPQNTSALVIAGPRTRLLPGEIKQIEDYIGRGGNVLWLADPGPLYGLEPVAEMVGLEFQPGTVVDPASQLITGNRPTFVVIGKYGNHPVVQNLNIVTLFPDAAALKANAPKGWHSDVLLDVGPQAWVETGPLNGNVQFDKGKDEKGPLNLAVTFSREQEKRQQRIAVVGDGDFLSNAFVGNGGNLDLGNNLINWVVADDAYISIPSRPAADLSLNLSRTAQITIAVGFMIALPLLFVVEGGWVWWRRRRR
jgi:ABC-type uncharacterized transport system involved in gliding motility auxiliary subunit